MEQISGRDDDIPRAISIGIMNHILDLRNNDPLRLDVLLARTWRHLPAAERHEMTAPYRLLYGSSPNLDAMRMHIKAATLAHYIKTEFETLMQATVELQQLPETTSERPASDSDGAKVIEAWRHHNQ